MAKIDLEKAYDRIDWKFQEQVVVCQHSDDYLILKFIVSLNNKLYYKCYTRLLI